MHGQALRKEGPENCLWRDVQGAGGKNPTHKSLALAVSVLSCRQQG